MYEDIKIEKENFRQFSLISSISTIIENLQPKTRNSFLSIYLILSKLFLTARIAIVIHKQPHPRYSRSTWWRATLPPSLISSFFLFFFLSLSFSLLFNNAVAQNLLSLVPRTNTRRYGSHIKLAIYQWHGSPYKRIDQWYNAYAISRPRVQNWNTIYTRYEDASIPTLI